MWDYTNNNREQSDGQKPHSLRQVCIKDPQRTLSRRKPPPAIDICLLHSHAVSLVSKDVAASPPALLPPSAPLTYAVSVESACPAPAPTRSASFNPPAVTPAPCLAWCLIATCHHVGCSAAATLPPNLSGIPVTTCVQPYECETPSASQR